MSYQTIATEIRDRILTITLTRPDRLNAFNSTMLEELLGVLDDADADDEVRAIIFTGAGRGYCAGADLGEGGSTFDSRGSAEGDAENRDGGGLLTLRLFECKKPVIAAINGPAVGVGITMTLAMDIRIASDKARIGFVFARRGIVPEACSSWFLPRIVGISQAMEWVATGRVFSAQEALEGRLVSRVVSAEDLLPTARAIAARDRGEHQRRLGVSGAPSALEDARRRPPDGGPQARLEGDPLDGPLAGRLRGGFELPRETAAELQHVRLRGSARVLSLVEGASLQRLSTDRVTAASLPRAGEGCYPVIRIIGCR